MANFNLLILMLLGITLTAYGVCSMIENFYFNNNIKEYVYKKNNKYCCNCYFQGNNGSRTFCLLNQEIVGKYSRTDMEFRYIDCEDSYCEKKCKWKAREDE